MFCKKGKHDHFAPPPQKFGLYAHRFFGGILHFCYAAHNATAFKTIVLHFCKMPAPYEYLRLQTLASKFARSTLTE